MPKFKILTTCFFFCLYLFGTNSEFVSTAEAAPSNDMFAAAIELTGNSGTVSGTSVEATAENFEPAHYSPAHHSVWYTWVAPNNTPIDFDTQGSDFDTVLAVYTGNSVDGLTLVNNNDDDPLYGCCTSRVTFTPVQSTIYSIAVDGFDSDSGNIALNWGAPPPTQSITGKISLPSGTAPAGGISLSVSAHEIIHNIWVHTNINITEGSSNGTYTIEVVDDVTMSWDIFYNSGEIDYINRGYYSSAGTTFDPNEATPLAGGQGHPNIDLTLLTGVLISGKVSLPSGTAPTGGVNCSVDVNNANDNNFSEMTHIPEGSSFSAYNITVPDTVTMSWQISYNCWDTNYVNPGYYSSTGTTPESSMATLLEGGQHHPNTDLTLLLPTTPTIAGDVNNSGEVNLVDAILSLQVIAGMSPANVVKTADINSDTQIGLAEVVYALQKTVADYGPLTQLPFLANFDNLDISDLDNILPLKCEGEVYSQWNNKLAEYTTMQITTNSQSTPYSINLIPNGNPSTTEYGILSSAILSRSFDVSTYNSVVLSFSVNSTSNPRINSIHNCDSSLDIFYRLDGGAWQHFSSYCGQHKTESSGWRYFDISGYPIITGNADTIEFAFEYYIQNSISDTSVYYLIDDFGITGVN